MDYLVVIIPTLVSIRLWSFQAAPEHALWSQVEKALVVALIAVTAWRSKQIKIPQMKFSYKWHILSLFLLSFTSFLPLFYFDNQSPLSSFNTNMHMTYWLVYFAAYSTQISRDDILKLIVFIGIVWAILTIGQQFTYPRVYFFSRANFENEVPFEIRSGIYRYMVQGGYFAMLTSYYAFNQFLCTSQKWYLAILGLMLAAVY